LIFIVFRVTRASASWFRREHAAISGGKSIPPPASIGRALRDPDWREIFVCVSVAADGGESRAELEIAGLDTFHSRSHDLPGFRRGELAQRNLAVARPRTGLVFVRVAGSAAGR